MELSMLVMERPGLVRKALKTSELLWENPFQESSSVTNTKTSLAVNLVAISCLVAGNRHRPFA